MNHFNGSFAKAFPERTAGNIKRVLLQEAALAARDPYGFLELEKRVHHFFQNNDRIRVNLPGHETHGHAGKIVDDRTDNHLEVKLDSGHTIHVPAWELIPEDFPVAASTESEKIAKAALYNPMFVDDESDVLAKRAKSKFRVGDRVVEKLMQREGTVIAVSPSGLIEIKYGPGHTGLTLADALEAAA